MLDNKNLIAKRVAQELHDGDVVNLGIGVPQLVPNYLPSDVNIMFEVENGNFGRRRQGSGGSAGRLCV